MHLKQMELIGFKSFAEKTVFRFEPGVTAFVGPNGAGKSNVVDAIRWALGEQSAKRLRGENMGDVIFAGTPTHRPAGFSEVSLIFDNSDRALPVDYDEVVVSRRLFRTGESEYMINRQLCLLRDIRELFIGTGIGGGAYNIVEQGKVDALLQAGPLERRRLFEEVAGISGYKLRRDAAQRRLERLALHLEAAGAILEDVNRRVRALARQVGRARHYAELSEQLRRLELDLAARKYAVLEAAARQTAANIETHRAELARLQTQLADLDAAELDEAGRRATLQQQLAAERAALTDARVAAERAAAAAGSAIERKQAEEKRANERAEAAAQAIARKQQLETEATAAEAAAAQLQADITAARQQTAELKEQALQLAAAADAAAGRLAALRDQAFEVASRRARLESDLASAASMRQALLRKSQAVAGKLAELDSREQALAAALAATEADIEAASVCFRRLDRLHAALARRQDATARATERISRYAERVRRATERVQQRRQLLEDAERTGACLTDASAGLCRTLAGRQDFRGLLSTAMNAPAQYRRAVEAALGSAAEAAVIEAEYDTDALAALQPLRGDVVFAKEPAAPVVLPVIDFPGATALLKILEAPAALEPLLARLLGRAFIVPDVGTAIQFVRQYPQLSAVTPEGAVLRGLGYASVRGDAAAGQLVGRGHERDMLRAEEERLEQRLALASRKLAARTARRQRFAAAALRLRGKLDEVRQRLAALEAGRQTAAAELEQHRSHAGFLAEETRALDAETLAAQQAAAELPGRVAELQATEAAVSSQISAAEAERQQWLGELEVRRGQLVTSETSLARLEEKAASLASAAEAFLRSAADAEAAAHVAQAATVAASQAAADAAGQAAQAEAGRLRAVTSAAEADQRIKALAADLENLDAERVERASQRHVLEAQVTTTRNTLEALRLDENTALLERNALASRIRELYHQELDALAAASAQPLPPAPDEQAQLEDIKRKLESIGPVNLAAIEEERELKERQAFLAGEIADLETARSRLAEAIERLDAFCRQRFLDAFERVAANFQELFRRLFQGGDVRLRLLEDDALSAGIEITVRPPGKEPRVLSLLSGGEKAMAAIALIMAAFKASPSPFCVLDEVDGPLDEANVERLNMIIRDFTERTQFILVTHNKLTMTRADVIYGITMETPGVSRHIRRELVRTGAQNLAVA